MTKFTEEEVRALYIVVKNEQLIRTSKGDANDPASQDKLDPSKPYFELYK